jgi:hypothetical protein
MKESENEAILWIALAIGVPLGIAALFWGLSQLIVAFGTAVGIAGAFISAGSSVGDAVEVWAVRVAAIGLGAGGASIGYKVVVNISQNIESNVFNWALPLISIFAGLLVELNKEFYPATPLLKHLFAALFAFTVLVAGYLFTKKSTLLKVCGFVLVVIPPGLFLVRVLSGGAYTQVDEAFSSVSWGQYATLGCFFALVALIAILASRARGKS